MVLVEGRNPQFLVHELPSLVRQLLCFVFSSQLSHQLAIFRSQMDVTVGFREKLMAGQIENKGSG